MTLPPYTRTREGETRQLGGEWSELPLGGPLSYEKLSNTVRKEKKYVPTTECHRMVEPPSG
jgi:hypothetical protein